MTSKMIFANGTNIHVEDTGEEDLPVLLCLHSAFVDGRMFDKLVPAAAGRYRIVRPDFRGQGQSDSYDGEEISMDLLADDIAALVEQLGLTNINLAAQSIGGDVAFRLISRDQSKYRALVVMGSSACAEPADQLQVFREWVNGVRTNGFTGDTLQETMDVMFGQTTQSNPEQAEMLSLWRDRIRGLPESFIPAMVGVVERKSSLHLLDDIKIPVLIFSGEEDQPRPPAWSDQMEEHLPNSRLVRLWRIGHSNILEAPEVVIPGMLEHFDSASKPSRHA